MSSVVRRVFLSSFLNTHDINIVNLHVLAHLVLFEVSEAFDIPTANFLILKIAMFFAIDFNCLLRASRR